MPSGLDLVDRVVVDQHLASADSIKDINLGGGEFRGETLQPLDVITAGKDVDVLSYLPCFREHPIAKGSVLMPERFQRIAYGGEFACKADLYSSAGERFEVAAEMDSHRHQI